jgi:diaminopimelate decarboxylase
VHLAFAVKANPNLAVLRVLARLGYGADIVSGGEMARALAAGMPSASIVFSGVGKSPAELADAVDADVGRFNLEHEAEAYILAELSEARGKRVRAALRINPDVDANTHQKISTGKSDNKFGVAFGDAPAVYARLSAVPRIEMVGLACHIGSQLLSLDPLEIAYRRLGTMIAELRNGGLSVSRADLGGGLGIAYEPTEQAPSLATIGSMVAAVTHDWNVQLMFEPGRVIVGEAGLLLTEVLWVKPGPTRPYVIVDAAMNDLARPALYDAYHHFQAVRPSGERMTAHIAGPVCESGDTFAMHRDMDKIGRGDLAVFHAAGAYGATMASTYNSRPLIPEVMVDGDRYEIIAKRVSVQQIMDGEAIPSWLD